jgi:DNA-binding MarR family transcriptional regulator
MPQAPPTAAPSPLQSLLHLLHRAGQRADALFARRVSDALTPRQFVILQAVAQSNGLSQVQIMAATGIDRSSITDLVARLVRRGCLRRRRRKRDARLYAVTLTAEGRRLLGLGEPAAQGAGEELLSPLSPAERSSFLKSLTTVAMEVSTRLISALRRENHCREEK